MSTKNLFELSPQQWPSSNDCGFSARYLLRHLLDEINEEVLAGRTQYFSTGARNTREEYSSFIEIWNDDGTCHEKYLCCRTHQTLVARNEEESNVHNLLHLFPFFLESV